MTADRTPRLSGVGDIRADNGMISFPDAHRRRLALSSVSAHEIVNLALFFDVCAHING